MADREKVIRGLECCAVKNITPEAARHCGICPYDRERNGEMDFDCQNDLLCAALGLLKEQQSAYERGKRDGVSQYLREREEDEEYEY